MKKILLGTAAGGLWLFAFSLALCPIYNYKGILATLGCIIGGFILFSVGCTVALTATSKIDGLNAMKEVQDHVRETDAQD